MKIWITGSNGMLGKAFLRACKKREIDTVSSSKEEVDITSRDAIQKFIKTENPTHIINCAAYTDVEKAEDEEEKAFKVNVKGIENLAQAAKKHAIKLVHFSASHVFDGLKNTPYNETDFCNPLTIFGKTKWEGEIRLFEICDDALLIRSSELFGHEGDNLVKKIREQLEKEESLSFENKLKGLTFCDDLAEASLDLLSYSGIFHITNTGLSSPYEIAKIVLEYVQKTKKHVKCKKLVSESSTENHFSSQSILCTKKTQRHLKKSLRHWKDALDDCLKMLTSR